MLGDGTCARIIQVLFADERATTDEIAVAVIRSTGGVPIETWGTGLFNAWGIGKRGSNHGVLLVVATDDHRLRIVTGSGLTDRLSDGAASEIVDGTITPLFKAGRMQDGVLAGLDAIRRDLGHDTTVQLADPNMPPIPAATQTPSDSTPAWVVLPIVLGGFGLVGYALFRSMTGGASWGGNSSGSGSSLSSNSSGSSGSGFGGGSSSGGGASGSW